VADRFPKVVLLFFVPGHMRMRSVKRTKHPAVAKTREERAEEYIRAEP
jgi:hypothetical protein